MLSIHSLCSASIVCPSSITHTHYSSLLLLQRSKERLGVFMLPTVVLEHGWREGRGGRKQRNSFAHFAAQKSEHFLLPPFVTDVLNNHYEGFRLPLKRLSLTVRISIYLPEMDKDQIVDHLSYCSVKSWRVYLMVIQLNQRQILVGVFCWVLHR